jgi:DNA-binding LacI/PurR family transcriptional regulator
MHAIRNHGLRCTEDISVTGFYGMDWADLMDPPMTTVEQSATEYENKWCYTIFTRSSFCLSIL